MSNIAVTILHGFLGSGKTTLLRNIIQQAQREQRKLSVIVNDMSDLDVDGVLIANTDVIHPNHSNFVSISGDSLCSSTGIVKLSNALTELALVSPDWIVIETSGSSHPLPLIEFFKNHRQFALKDVVTLVDATWLRDDYAHGNDLIPRWQNNLQHAQRGVENLLVEQIMFSNKVLLTKADKVEHQVINNIAQSIHPLNAYTDIVKTTWGNFNIKGLNNQQDYNFFLVEQLIDELRDSVHQPLSPSGKNGQTITAKVLKDDRPFHPTRLWETCHQYLTKGIFRSKGFFWLPSRDNLSLLWSQANGNVSLEVTGIWRASVLKDPTQLFSEVEKRLLQEKIDSVESRFGDRRCRLTVIGQSDEVEDFINALQRCFLTQAEIQQWHNGEAFADPWPAKMTKLTHG